MIDPISLALIVYLAGFIALVGRICIVMQIKGLSDMELVGAFAVAVLWVPAFTISIVLKLLLDLLKNSE